jgi:hypothetical protein
MEEYMTMGRTSSERRLFHDLYSRQPASKQKKNQIKRHVCAFMFQTQAPIHHHIKNESANVEMQNL